MGGKVCLICKGKTLLGIANKTFDYKTFVDITLQCFVLLPQLIWIFTEGVGDGIESS